MLRPHVLIVSIVCQISFFFFFKLKTTWNLCLNSNKADREWLVRTSYNNTEGWTIYYPCSACETQILMSALQAARHSDLEHSGLDQDPVIEGFGV